MKKILLWGGLGLLLGNSGNWIIPLPTGPGRMWVKLAPDFELVSFEGKSYQDLR